MKTRIIFSVMSVIFIVLIIMSGCATTSKISEPTTADSTLLIGRIKLTCSNFPNYVHVNGEHTKGITIDVRNMSTGEVLTTKSKGADGLFYFDNPDAGEYAIVGYNITTKGGNVRATFKYLYDTSNRFNITPNAVNNFGDISWVCVFETITDKEYSDRGASHTTANWSNECYHIGNYAEVKTWFKATYPDSAWNNINWNSLEFISKTTAVTVDFDRKTPDYLYTRKGAHLEIVYDPLINDTQMGLITLPSGVPGVQRSLRPYGSFQIDYLGKLGNTITSFRTYVTGKLSDVSRSPYIVYAVTVDDDPRPEAYVVGRRIVGSEIAQRPEEECPVETWFECRLDRDTLVHVADFRENLGNNFTTWNYGTLANLVKTPLRDEIVWGDLDIVFVEIGAGAWGGHPPYKAYVDDINVVSGP